MKRPDEPGESVTLKECGRCGVPGPEKEIARCPWCFRDFCRRCRYPRGIADFCSRGCAEAMFHGADDEDSPEDEKDAG